MPNRIYIIDPSNNTTLTPPALAQVLPSTTKLPTSSQNPAVSIIQSASGQSAGISGYAYGYASVVADSGYYDAGSAFFSTNVSQLTIQQITNALSGNTTPIFGAVQINLSTLNSLVSNNTILYSNVTLFSPDIQSAMMTDLAIEKISTSDISHATTVLGLPGISDALAYYAANFSINPIKVFNHYSPTDLVTTMGSTFSVLSAAPITVKNATIHAIVNGKSVRRGGLGLFQGFNSWNIYPSNMSGYDSTGNYIKSITIPGRGNNPGVANNSQFPINEIGFSLSKLAYLTQHSLKSLLNTISNLTSVESSKDIATLNDLGDEASNALALLPLSTQYSSSPDVSNVDVATANVDLQNAYNAYEQNPNNPVLASELNTAIANFIDANTIGNNINDAIDNGYAELDTNIVPVTSTNPSIYNPFPNLSILQTSNALIFSSNVANTSIQGMTLSTVMNNVTGNTNVVASGSTVPSLVTNPTLAMVTISGQTSNLITPIDANSSFNFSFNS